MADLSQTTPGPRPGRAAWRRARGYLATPWAAILAILAAVALFDPAGLGATIAFAGRALAQTALYVLFAVVLLAWLKASGADALVARAFVGRETRMIVLAALFGGLAPFCSCEVIPFVAGLLALGVPLSAVMAFWLSSPLIDPPTLLITAAALGWPFALAKAAAAVGLGLLGGFALRAVMAGGGFAAPLRAWRPAGCCGAGPKPGEAPVWAVWRDRARRRHFRAEFLANAVFLLKWLALAYTLEALLVRHVPAEVIAGLVGGTGIAPVITAALVGMPAYLNAYVAPPLLAGLMEQGMSAGAAMAFMIAGSVSSIPAMAAVWSLVRPRVFAAYLGLGLVGAVLAGLAFDLVV